LLNKLNKLYNNNNNKQKNKLNSKIQNHKVMNKVKPILEK